MMHTANIAFPNLKIGAICLLGYGFDNAWEIVPGSGPNRSGIRTACWPSGPLR